MKYRITNGLLLTPNGIEQKDLLIADGKIEAIIPQNAEVSGDYQTLDCGGRYVSAGFVEIHQHGGGGSDYMDNDPDAFLNATNAHLAHGMTSVMPTLLSADQNALLSAIDRYLQAKKDPRIL